MKKLLLLMLIFLSISTFCQNYQWDTIVVYDSSNNVKHRHTQQFNWLWNLPSTIKTERYNGSWTDSLLNTYDYDENGNIITETIQKYKDNNWVNVSSQQNFYVNNKITSTVYLYWLDTIWRNSQKSEFIYNDTTGLLYITKQYYYQSNQWVLWFRYRYISYTSNGNYQKYIRETMGMDSLWYNHDMSTCTYILTPEGKEKTLYNINYRWANNNWVYNSINSYTYDLNFNCIEHKLQNWINNSWVNYQGGHSTFNSNNDRINYTWMIRDSISGLWVEKYRLLTNFDQNHNSISQTSEEKVNDNWQPTHWVLMINSGIIGEENTKWYHSNGYRYDATFLPFYVGINEINNKIDIYPNPTKDIVNLGKEYKNIKIYSLLGNKLNEYHDISYINLNGYDNGLYLLLLDNKYQIKIIKQ